MSNALKFYINGAWVDPVKPATLEVINPATEEPYTKISVGSAADVDRAVAAARGSRAAAIVALHLRQRRVSLPPAGQPGRSVPAPAQ